MTPADTEATARKAAEEIAQYGAGRVRERHPDLPVEARAVAGYAGKVLAAQAGQPDVHAFHQLAIGSASALLVEASRRADLLVTGARRHGEGRHGMLIGPVTQTLLQHAECPVAVVPQ